MGRNRRVRAGIGLALAVCSVGVTSGAPSRDQESCGGGNGERACEKPVNLKVLPKSISGAELRKVMKRFKTDLGVTCNYCHVENAEMSESDYASDDNPAKEKTRLMITMLNDINYKYLAQFGGDQRYDTPVTCGSCHLGQSTPPAFDPK
jgi:hypothetical protein